MKIKFKRSHLKLRQREINKKMKKQMSKILSQMRFLKVKT